MHRDCPEFQDTFDTLLDMGAGRGLPGATEEVRYGIQSKTEADSKAR